MSASRRPDPNRFHFHNSTQVRFRDVDSMNHVNHAVYLTYFEMARCEYWMKVFRLRKLSDINFIVARVECNYLNPALFGEWIDVFVAVTEVRNSSFIMEYEAWVRRPRRRVAAGLTVQVLFDYAGHRPQTIPAAVRRRLEQFEKRSLSANSISSKIERAS